MEKVILVKFNMLNIHLEYCDDKGEKLRKISKLNKPFCISLIPILLTPEHKSFGGVYSKNYSYPKEIVELLKELAKNSNIIFGQQGLLHYCKNCFLEKDKKDSWHENYCLYKKPLSIKEQMKFMQEGKKIIEEKLSISPKLYVPPNHMFDNNTLIAAKKLGFEYFADRAMRKLSPYSYKGLVILPEIKLGQDGEIVYTHYDEMTDNFNEYLNFIKSPNYLGKIIPKKVSQSEILENERLKLEKKKKRDLDKINRLTS